MQMFKNFIKVSLQKAAKLQFSFCNGTFKKFGIVELFHMWELGSNIN